jgi:hypothetical protein
MRRLKKPPLLRYNSSAECGVKISEVGRATTLILLVELVVVFLVGVPFHVLLSSNSFLMAPVLWTIYFLPEEDEALLPVPPEEGAVYVEDPDPLLW